MSSGPILAKLISLNQPKWTNFDITKKETKIGRVDSDIVFDVNLVSGLHCTLKLNPNNTWHLIDHSSNGTYVNGEKIGKGNERQIASGNEISLVVKSSAQAKQNEKFKESFIAFVFHDMQANPGMKMIHADFDVVKELGSGNFATVHLAMNRKSGEKVAIKIIDRKKWAQSTALRPDQLTDEVKIMKGVNHPHIMRVFDVYDTPDQFCIVMELVTGGDLFDAIVNREKYKEPEAKHIFTQLASAVAYLHDHGIAHRDLKPENILLKMEGENTVKLTDFGLSRIMEGSFMKTLCGTPQYLAPEIILESEGVTDSGYTKAVDVWSLGVILYILLSGSPPFGDDAYDEIKAGKFSFSDSVWKTVSKDAQDLIKKMLTVNVAKRITIDEVFGHAWMKDEKRIMGEPVDPDLVEKINKNAKKQSSAEISAPTSSSTTNSNNSSSTSQSPAGKKKSTGSSPRANSKASKDEDMEEAEELSDEETTKSNGSRKRSRRGNDNGSNKTRKVSLAREFAEAEQNAKKAALK